MRPRTCHNLSSIMLNVTVSHETDLWKNLLVKCLNSKIKFQRRVLTVHLLRKLKEANVGTNDVEHYLKRQKLNDHWKSVKRRAMMQAKIKHALFEQEKSRAKYTQAEKYLNRRWGQNQVVMGPFHKLMQEEIEYIWEKGSEKNKKKIENLTRRWKPAKQSKETVETWEGIIIGDSALNERFGEVKNTSEPVVYGGVELSENEQKAAALPPKLTTYEQLKQLNIMAACERLKATMRWEVRNREKREGRPWSAQEELEEVLERTVLDEDAATMSFAKRKVTDMKTNRDINVGEAVDSVTETVLASLSASVHAVAEKYIASYCDKYGNIIETNLTKEEIGGLKSLKERVKTGEISVLPTDKSGRLAVNTTDNYITRMQTHVTNDPVIDWKEKCSIENVLNGHTLQLGRILKVGENWQHSKRVQSALRNKSCHVPVLYGQWKDHKNAIDEAGPSLRPVCGASEANNGQISQLLAEVMMALAAEMDKDIGTACASTEELLHEMDKVNEMQDKRDKVIMSSDIESMYPRLQIDEVAAIVAQEYQQTNLEVDVDTDELSLYLAVVLKDEEINELGLSEVIKTSISGRKIGVTTREIVDRGNTGATLFNPAARQPTQAETRLMMSLALRELVKASMNNHIYSFNGTMRRQHAGGSIGNCLTGSIATVFVLHWTKLFLEKLKTATEDLAIAFVLYFIKYYVDDANLCLTPFPPGSRLINGKIQVMDEHVETDKGIPEDIRTAEIIKELANSVLPSTKLTVDCPSMHESGWMPCLDVQTKMRNGHELDYKFYQKNMVNRHGMPNKSAMPMNIKRNSCAEQVIRRQRNTRRGLPDYDEVIADTLTEYSRDMQEMGYSESFRLDIIKAGVTGYRRQCAAADAGGTPLHRPRSYNRPQRRARKLLARTSWYRPQYDAVFFLPTTPNDQLRKLIQPVVDQEAARLKMRVKCVSTSGVSIRRQICKTDYTGCPVPQCPLCRSDLPGASHTRSSGAYLVSCKLCAEKGVKAEYDGETGDSNAWRALQHCDDIKHKREKSAMHKHLAIHHEDQVGNPEAFTFRSVRVFPNKCLDRKTFEGTAITANTADIQMNSSSEFRQPAVPRVVLTRTLPDTESTVNSGRGRGRGRGAGRARGAGRGRGRGAAASGNRQVGA